MLPVGIETGDFPGKPLPYTEYKYKNMTSEEISKLESKAALEMLMLGIGASVALSTGSFIPFVIRQSAKTILPDVWAALKARSVSEKR